MKEVAISVFDFLKQVPELTSFTANRIYPVLAKDVAVFPFAVYTIGEVPYISKDAREFPVKLGVYFQGDKIMDSMDLADVLKEKIEDSVFNYQSSQVDSDFEEGVVFLEIFFNIIK